MSAADAAAAAGITYRQLDYWERQGWVRPAHIEDISPGRRVRRYSPLDVARLAALRHLARSGFDVAVHGPIVGQLPLVPGVAVVAGGDPEQLRLVDIDNVVAVVSVEGRWTVFDPTEHLSPVAVATPKLPLHAVSDRRTA
jgi:hypothetical protein